MEHSSSTLESRCSIRSSTLWVWQPTDEQRYEQGQHGTDRLSSSVL